jgi:hypothetical protein
MVMAIGDKQAAVRECADAVLIDHGIPQPIDRTKSLSDYHYAKENMPPFHASVRDALKDLKDKRYDYSYTPSDDYMRKTVAMPLLILYSTISGKTSALVNLNMTASFAAKAKKAAPKKAARKAAKKSGKKTARG